MKNYIKSALDKIKAEDTLKAKTELNLRKTLAQDGGAAKYSKKRFFAKKYAVAACAAIVLCGMTAGGYAYYRTPVAYVSLDINPSVELGVNAFDVVVSADAYNDDGETVLNGQDVINTNVQDAVQTLVQSASDNGFVKDDGSTIISITAETDNDQTAENLETISEQGADNAIEGSDATAVVYTDNVALQRRTQARELGITPGKLNLIQKIMALDSTATVDEYKDATVTDIMKKVIALQKTKKAETKAETKNGFSYGSSEAMSGSEISSAVLSDSSAYGVSSDEDSSASDIMKIQAAVEKSEKNTKSKNNKSSVNSSSSAVSYSSGSSSSAASSASSKKSNSKKNIKASSTSVSSGSVSSSGSSGNNGKSKGTKK